MPRARRVTFTGYSAAWVAGVLPADGKVICCEINDQYAAIARKHWAAAGVAGKIELRMGPALDTLKALGVEHKYLEIPGGLHSDVVAPNVAAIIDFFDAHRKTAAATSQQR